jgi:hypothetical protein
MGYISSQTLTIEDQSFLARFVKGVGTHCCHGVNSVTAALEFQGRQPARGLRNRVNYGLLHPSKRE